MISSRGNLHCKKRLLSYFSGKKQKQSINYSHVLKEHENDVRGFWVIGDERMAMIVKFLARSRRGVAEVWW